MASAAAAGQEPHASDGGSDEDVYVWGYGSITWRPGFEFVSRWVGWIHGFKRRFWQGSPEHRGSPSHPGCVVTLLEDPDATVYGTLYRIHASVAEREMGALLHREQAGYTRTTVDVHCEDGVTRHGFLFLATTVNRFFLGERSAADIAAAILTSRGHSGRNIEYFRRLYEAMEEAHCADDHLRAIATALDALEATRPQPGSAPLSPRDAGLPPVPRAIFSPWVSLPTVESARAWQWWGPTALQRAAARRWGGGDDAGVTAAVVTVAHGGVEAATAGLSSTAVHVSPIPGHEEEWALVRADGAAGARVLRQARLAGAEADGRGVWEALCEDGAAGAWALLGGGAGADTEPEDSVSARAFSAAVEAASLTPLHDATLVPGAASAAALARHLGLVSADDLVFAQSHGHAVASALRALGAGEGELAVRVVAGAGAEVVAAAEWAAGEAGAEEVAAEVLAPPTTATRVAVLVDVGAVSHAVREALPAWAEACRAAGSLVVADVTGLAPAEAAAAAGLADVVTMGVGPLFAADGNTGVGAGAVTARCPGRDAVVAAWAAARRAPSAAALDCLDTQSHRVDVVVSRKAETVAWLVPRLREEPWVEAAEAGARAGEVRVRVAEAEAWRYDALRGVSKGTARGTEFTSVWLEDAATPSAWVVTVGLEARERVLRALQCESVSQ